MDLKFNALDRFLRYIKIDTQSNENSLAFPSTEKQFDLALLLAKELHELGLGDANVDDHCYVTATLSSTTDNIASVIGLIAHLDTSSEVSGKNVKPVVIQSYQGGDIVLDMYKSIIIRESEDPELSGALGHTIVTSDGSTLLGADDKAGIAAIMTAVEYLKNHPDIPHGIVKIVFTPDEEIGRGIDFFDLDNFGADFAYTVDGGFTGELNDETFSADAAIITITGRDMHPGSAKDRMVNSIKAMAELITRLPSNMAPETTGGRNAFIHPQTLNGSVGCTTIKLLLRDFTENGLNNQKIILCQIIDDVKAMFPQASFDLNITPTYRNMRQELLRNPHVLNRLEDAVLKTGIKPIWRPIRGGTDGAVLTSRGLPTPNIFTGSCNSHSLTEWQDIDGLVKVVETIINLLTLN